MAGIQAGGGSAGRLSIEIVAEVARLQADLDKCKRAVNAASADIGRSAKAANDNLSAIGRGAGAGVQQFSRDVATLKANLDPAWASMQRYRQEVALAQKALSQGAISHAQYVQEIRRSATAAGLLAKKSEDLGNAQRASSGSGKQFAMQMSQVGQQVMAGTGAVQALAMQLPDIAVGMSNAGAGAGRFAQFLGGPLGIALTTGIALLATFAAGHYSASKAEEEHAKKAKELSDAIDQLHKSTVRQMQSTYASIQATIADAETKRLATIQTKENTVAELENARARLKSAQASQGANVYGNNILSSSMAQRAAGEIEEIDKKLGDLNSDLAKTNTTILGQRGLLAKLEVAAEFDRSAAAALSYDRTLDRLWKQLRAGKITMDQYKGGLRDAQRVLDAEQEAIRQSKEKERGASAEERRAARLARESVATEVLVAGLYKLAEAYGVSDAAAMQAEITAEATAQGIKKQADVAEYVAQQLQKATAEQVVAGARAAADLNYQAKAQSFVNAAVKAGTLDVENASTALANMAEQRGLLTAMNAAGAAGDKQGYEAAKKALDALTKAQIADNKARREAADLQQADQIKRSIEDTQLETRLMKDLGAARLAALRGLSGDALEDELARIALEHEKIAIQARAEAEATRLLKLGYGDAAAAVRAKAEADKAQADARFEIEKQTVAIERYNDQLRNTIGLLGNLGKVGEGLGAILGIITGNTGSVGGPLGDLLNLGMKGRNDKGEEIASTIGAEVSKIFKKDGAFVKAMQPLLQNAGIGMAAGSALFGKQSASEQAGSAIGGALGGKLGEKALSKGLESIAKGLGDFAGPLGSIVGGVLGNVLGSAFTKVKWGRVDLSASGVSDTAGNSKSSQKAALAAGNSIFGGLQDLARQFGGTIGDFGNISVGVRHGDYRVNTGGTSLKVKKGAVDFNDDAEAAVAYAMKMAIERGAINGIRQSTNNLLKAGDDLATQINKALSFEGVFSELKSYLDPVGYEVEGLEKEFASLRTIFAEAGATAAEYAQLEQLLTIKRQEALNKEQDALNDIRSRIAEVQGDDATVKAIARAKELHDATSDAQRAELQRLYALEDAAEEQAKLTEAQNAATAAAEQLRQAWKSVGTSIMDEVNRIRGLTGGDDAASFVTLQGRFNAAVNAARSGDQEAASRLVDLSQSLLEAAGNAATSRQELDRIRAQTAATLEGVYGYIEALDGRSPSASAVSASTAVTAGTEPTLNSGASSDAAAEMRSLRAELAQMRADMNNGNAALISSSNRIARRIEDVSPNGDAIAVASAA